MAKNRQKSAKIAKQYNKNQFSLQQLPKKGQKGPKMAQNDQLETVRTLDLPAGDTLAKRRPLCVDGDYEKTACE